MLSIGSVIRGSELGVWYEATGGSALLLDGTLTGSSEAVNRLIGCVQQVQSAAVAGVAKAIDLVADAGNIWLIVEASVAPTLADILADADSPVDPIELAHRTADTLLELHQAGIVHGAVGPATIVVRDDGPVLVETGIRLALAGGASTTPDQGMQDDVTGWAAAMTSYAAALVDRTAVWGLLAAAQAATTGGLKSAIAVLDMRVAAGPAEARSLVRPAVLPVAAAVLADPVICDPRTLMGQRNVAPSPPGAAENIHVPTSRAATVPGKRAPSAEFSRSGPGVPLTGLPTASPASPRRAPRRARRGAWRSGIITALIAIAVVAFILWRYLPAMAVSTISVTPIVPATGSCDISVRFNGAIHTSGRGGVLTYKWVRNDGQQTADLRQSVLPGKHTVDVSMVWTFGGVGMFPATATLTVISPAAASGVGTYTYRCVTQ